MGGRGCGIGRSNCDLSARLFAPSQIVPPPLPSLPRQNATPRAIIATLLSSQLTTPPGKHCTARQARCRLTLSRSFSLLLIMGMGSVGSAS